MTKASWPVAPLESLCRFHNGGTPSRTVPEFFDGDIPWLTGADIQGPLAGDCRTYLTEAGIRSSPACKVPKGTILLVTRTSVGKVAVAERELSFSQDITALRPDEGRVDTSYLVHFLRTQEKRFQMDSRGATIKGITREVVATTGVPLPPLPEQRRIAHILDQADALRAKRRAALAELDSLQQSIFLDMFDTGRRPPVDLGEGNCEHSEGWKWILLTNEARLATGHTPDRKRPEYWNGDIPWISLTDIRKLDGRNATATSQTVTQEGIDHSSAVRLPEGTVCFSRTASVGFVTIMGREMSTSQDFVNWVCGPRLDPVYLMHAFLNSRARLRALSSGSTHKTIYFPTVEQFRVLLPPLSLQHDFANQVGKVMDLKAISEASIASYDTLFESLQHRAFQGEL